MVVLKLSWVITVLLTTQILATLVQTATVGLKDDITPTPSEITTESLEPKATMEIKTTETFTDQSKNVDTKTTLGDTMLPEKTSEQPKTPPASFITSDMETKVFEKTTENMVSEYTNDATTEAAMVTPPASEKPSGTTDIAPSSESNPPISTESFTTSSNIETSTVQPDQSTIETVAPSEKATEELTTSEVSTKDMVTSSTLSTDAGPTPTKSVPTAKSTADVTDASTKQVTGVKTSPSTETSTTPSPTKISLEEILEMFSAIEHERFFQRLPLRDRISIYELATGVQIHKITPVLQHMGFERLLTLIYNLPMKFIEQMIAFLLQGLKEEREMP